MSCLNIYSTLCSELIAHICTTWADCVHFFSRCDDLMEPKSSILAKLCVYCIYSLLEYHNITPQQGNSRKRSRRDMATEELETLSVPNKLLRLSETGDTSAIFGSSSPQAQSSPNGHKVIVLREPLSTTIDKLFTNFTYLASKNGEVSQKTHFILQFLQLMVLCGKERTRVVLQGMPQDLVPSLLKALPEFFTTDLLLKLYDIQTANGRRATARDLCMLRNINLKRSK